MVMVVSWLINGEERVHRGQRPLLQKLRVSL
jgi:hypothetical protein